MSIEWLICPGGKDREKEKVEIRRGNLAALYILLEAGIDTGLTH